MYLDRKFGLRLSLSEITLLFDLSLYLDRTLAQRTALSERLSQKLKLPNGCNNVNHVFSMPRYSASCGILQEINSYLLD